MKIAMIGTGGIARRHLESLVKEPGVEIVAHVSPTPGHADQAAHVWGGRAYLDLAEMLQHESVEAAWVTVPPAAHGSIEHSLIQRGIPFVVEKPLAADRQTAEEIGQAIADRGLVVAVGYQWRAMDTLAEVRQVLADSPARLVSGTWWGSTPVPDWWRRQASSGGQMVEQATHLFDLARYLIGEATVLAAHAVHPARPAYPDADVAGVSATLLRFESGATGLFTASCLLKSTAAVQLQLIGEGWLITITRQGVVFETGRERREVRTLNDPFITQNRAFLQAVRQGDPGLVLSSYADALHTHRLCFEVLEAGGG